MSSHDSSISHAELSALVAPLRCRSASGYRNVYRHRSASDGRAVYVARVKRGGVLVNLPGSASCEARRCALHVALWYRREFGEQWASVLAARKVNPFEIHHSKLFRGYYAVAYILGVRTPIERMVRLPRRFGRDRWKTLPGQLEVFATREEAKEGMRRYLRRMYGIFSECVLYRPGLPAEMRASAA